MKRILIVMLALISLEILADRVYLKPSEFVASFHGGNIPAHRPVVLDSATARRVKKVFGRRLQDVEARYYRDGSRSLWMLNEIGKTRPITAGFIVNSGRIESAKVLIYRESHGSEIHFRYFLKQFVGRKLAKRDKLDKRIDSISGATLSVNAMMKMAQVALILDQTQK